MAAKLCTNCGGMGEVFISRYSMSGMVTILDGEWQKCRDCDGAGYIKIDPK